MSFYVYIVASARNGTLYIGMTDDLARRIYEHKESILPSFSRRYKTTFFVWYEVHESRETAFPRERQIKKWNRVWKLNLIENFNPEWRDLYETLI